jgi:hypothetical protein
MDCTRKPCGSTLAGEAARAALGAAVALAGADALTGVVDEFTAPQAARARPQAATAPAAAAVALRPPRLRGRRALTLGGSMVTGDLPTVD